MNQLSSFLQMYSLLFKLLYLTMFSDAPTPIPVSGIEYRVRYCAHVLKLAKRLRYHFTVVRQTPLDRDPGLTFIAPRGFACTFWLARALDSLVRVSGRVGWVANIAADPWRRFTRAEPRSGGTTRLGRTEDSPHREQGPRPSPAGREGAASPLSTVRRGPDGERCIAAAASHLRPEPFQADLEPVAAHCLIGGTPQPAMCRSHPPAGC